MPLCSVQTYSDPEQAEAAYTATKVELTPTGRTPFNMRAIRVELENVWLHHVQESAPRIKHAEQTPSRAFIKFLAMPGSALSTQGLALQYEGILRHSHGHSYYERTSDVVQWASMSLPVELLEFAGSAVGGCNLAPLSNPSILTPASDRMTELRQLHRRAVDLTQSAPTVLAAPEVAHCLEQALIEAMIGCLIAPEVRDAHWAQRCHATIMRRFRRLLEDNPNRPIYVPEICAAIRVPERTLRLCCEEQLGMSPKQYLLLRRIHQAHRALSEATAATTTVTEIATKFGFWHFGRFAGRYRSIFGEPPLATLRRSPD